MWILILTVFYAGESVHIDHVDGFRTQADCMVAAKAWRGGFTAVGRGEDWAVDHAFAVCASKGSL